MNGFIGNKFWINRFTREIQEDLLFSITMDVKNNPQVSTSLLIIDYCDQNKFSTSVKNLIDFFLRERNFTGNGN